MPIVLDLVVSSATNNISTVIWEKDLNQEWVHKLEKQFERITIEKVAIVCIIGTNMDKPGVLANISNSLADNGINIKSGGFSLRKVNIQLIVAREDYKNTVIALNKNRLI